MKGKVVLWVLGFLVVIAAIAAGVFFMYKGAPGMEPADVSPPENNWNTYQNAELGFSLLYPASFTLDEAHIYEALGPGKEIRGVAFTVPESLTRGTNLSKDTYVSVETLGGVSPCSALPFIGTTRTESEVTEGGTAYFLARGSDAGAGNLYEEYVYAIKDSAPCTAFRYFIHSTNIANYDKGTAIEFDKGSLISAFDTVRQSYKAK